MISPDTSCTNVWLLHPLDATEISLQEVLALLFLKRYHAFDKKLCDKAYEILHKTRNQNLMKFVSTYYPSEPRGSFLVSMIDKLQNF